jgi:RNA polymerase primary sigma factor
MKAARTAGRIRRARREIENARADLVRANMRLVVWIARKRADRGLPLVDMVQEGNLGLMRAAEKFDYRKGVRFNTYAGYWIRQSINRALSDRSRTIRLPVHLLEARHKLAQFRQHFAQEHGREATAEEAAERIHVPIDTVREILRAPREPLSMDAPFGPEGDAKLGDIVADSSASSPLEAISAERLRSQVRNILPTLTPREQQVLRMRFGLDSPEEVTLQQIGVAFDLSRERIRQIEARALCKLREQAEEEGLDSYLSG